MRLVRAAIAAATVSGADNSERVGFIWISASQTTSRPHFSAASIWAKDCANASACDRDLVERNSWKIPNSISGPASRLEILGLEHDRLAVRGGVGGALPGIAIAGLQGPVGDAFLGDQAFERIEPVVVIGVARIGVARRLGALDLAGEGRRPFGPGKQPALMQRQRHREGLRLPWLAEHRPLLTARQTGQIGNGGEVERAHAGSRYG